MYYKTNAIYKYIEEKDLAQFEFVSGDLWQLIYGDSSCEPQLLVVVSAVKSSTITNNLNCNELRAYNRMKQISCSSELPLIFIRFEIDKEVDKVYIYENNGFIKKDTKELTEIYASFNLPVDQNVETTGKYLNDKESSAYHKWQRDTLGRSLKVSDIDLFKINELDNSIIEVYELKRSFIEINKWKPYTDDYNNFRLVGNLMDKCQIPFKIVYNVRKKDPWRDIIDELSVFEVKANNQELIGKKSIVTKQQFFG